MTLKSKEYRSKRPVTTSVPLGTYIEVKFTLNIPNSGMRACVRAYTHTCANTHNFPRSPHTHILHDLHALTCTHTHARTHARTHACTHTHAHTHTHTHTHTHIHTRRRIHACTKTHSRTHARRCIHARIQARTHARHARTLKSHYPSLPPLFVCPC